MNDVGRRPAAACPGLAARDSLYTPAHVVELDLAVPGELRSPGGAAAGAPGGRVLALVRLHGHPLGMVSVPGAPGDTADLYRALADAAHRQLAATDAREAPGPGSGPPVRAPGRVTGPAVSVIVATHNRPVMLRQCLDALLRSEHSSYEIVVVDNAPRDDAAERLVRAHYPSRVRFVREPKAGLARAHNRGLTTARGRICAFTDDDTLADPGWLAALERAFDDGAAPDGGPAVGCVTGLILPAELETPAQSALEGHGGFATVTLPAAPYTVVLRRRLRSLCSYEPLLRNGHVLVASSVMTAGLGAVYWVLATSWYRPETVGRSYAVISAVTLLGGIGQLNLADVLMRFAPSAGRHTRRLLLRSYAASGLCAGASAAAFLALVPLVAPGLGFLRGPLVAPFFIAGTIGYAWFIVQDGALTGVRRANWVLGENTIFAVVKTLALALAAAWALGSGILLSWAGALAVSLTVANYVLLRRAVPAHQRAHADGTMPPRLLGYAATDYSGALCRLAAYNIMPLIVLNTLGGARNAYFSLSWVIAYTLYQAAYNMGSSLLVETAHDPTRISELGRRVLRHTGPPLTVAVLLLVVAPWLLSVFGAEYAHEATGVLRLLALSALPNLLLNVAIDVARAHRRLAWAVALQATLCALVLVLTLQLIPRFGLNGVGAAWLLAECALALPLLLTLPRWLPSPARSSR
ncbi:glycosyltransferase [Streptomyces lydicus]|uniref:glycosyltransferase n=1 Tax=Streptomyces lydicus TaxID=47763 RepID=UPI003793E2ED